MVSFHPILWMTSLPGSAHMLVRELKLEGALFHCRSGYTDDIYDSGGHSFCT